MSRFPALWSIASFRRRGLKMWTRSPSALGVRDEAAVFGEPFRQWVIEDCFAGARPPLDLAGAQFVADAEPYEQIKMQRAERRAVDAVALGRAGGA